MQDIIQHMIFASEPTDTMYGMLLNRIDTYGLKRKLVENTQQVEEDYGTVLKKNLAFGSIARKVSAEGETVSVLMPNVTNTVCLIFGMSALGHIPAILNCTAGTSSMQNAGLPRDQDRHHLAQIPRDRQAGRCRQQAEPCQRGIFLKICAASFDLRTNYG